MHLVTVNAFALSTKDNVNLTKQISNGFKGFCLLEQITIPVKL